MRRESLVETAFLVRCLVGGISLGAEGLGAACGVSHACRQMEGREQGGPSGPSGRGRWYHATARCGCAAQQQTLEAAGIRAEWQHTELGYCPGQRMRHAETCGVAKWPCCARASDCSVLTEESVVLACRYWLRRYTQVRR